MHTNKDVVNRFKMKGSSLSVFRLMYKALTRCPISRLLREKDSRNIVVINIQVILAPTLFFIWTSIFMYMANS